MPAGISLKSRDDIARIAESGRILAIIFDELGRGDLAGVSSWEIDRLIESRILKLGGRPAFLTMRGYPAVSCVSLNHEAVHGLPSKKKRMRSGDIVKIDIGVSLKGYFSDACRTFIAGTASPDALRLVDAARHALDEGIAAAMPHARVGDIGKAIEECASLRGFSVVKSLAGHGTGFMLHEPPKVPHCGKGGTGPVLLEGMVLAIEPILTPGTGAVKKGSDGWCSVTADGSPAAQFEDTVALTAEGPRVLTVL